MERYKFQYGGDQQPQQQFDYTNTDFFNSVLDQSALGNYNNQQDDNSQQYEDINPNEDSDYIKSLRSYDSEQSQNGLSSRIDDLEQQLNSRFDNLQSQQEMNDWSSSDQGTDYFNDLYDSRTDSSPVQTQDLEQAQVSAESGGDNNAISPKGAMGAYQFMPSTWNENKPSPDASPYNRTDAQYAYNKYMGNLLTQFGNDKRKAVAAYNAGPGRVQGLVRQYGDSWEQHLPDETKGYLNKVFNIQTKPGANIENVNKNLLNIVSNVSQQFPGLVVSSGTDSKHTTNSAHYDGEAVDIGANSSNKSAYNNFKQNLPELKQKYGVQYIDEGDHIHVSLSTKGKR